MLVEVIPFLFQFVIAANEGAPSGWPGVKIYCNDYGGFGVSMVSSRQET